MNHIIIISFFLSVSTNQFLFSQKLQSQLEVEWRDKELFISGFCGITKVPYLVLRYINTSNESFYFYEANDEISDVLYHGLIYEPLLLNFGDFKMKLCDSIGVTTIGFRETENEYNVFIGKVPETNWWGWLITDKQTDKSPCGDDFPDPSVLGKLNKVASRLKNQEVYVPEVDSMAQLCDFCYPDKHYVSDTILYMSYEEMDSLDRILKIRVDSLANPEWANIINKRAYDAQINSIKSNFITIPPHGVYSKEYDLTHFKIVGGTYNFIYSPHQTETSSTFLRPEVEFPLKNSEDDENNYFTYHFPEKYKGYKLYKGKIKGSKVKIEIE